MRPTVFRSLSLTAVLILLGACEPVPPGCRTDTAREIRTIDKLIAESQAALARGYRMQDKAPDPVNLCLGGANANVGLSFCTDGGGKAPAAIDRQSEQRSLDGLKAKRAALVRQQAAEAATCGATS